MKTITHTLYIKSDKANPETGLAPIYCRIAVNGTKTSFSVNKSAYPLRWEKTRQFKLTNIKEEQEIRFFLDGIKSKLQKLDEKFRETSNSFTAEQIKNTYQGKDEERKNKTLMYVWNEYQTDFENKIASGTKAPNSIKKYHSCKKQVIEYLKSKNLTDIPLADINDKFLVSLHTFLKNADGISKNTSNRYLVSFKAVIHFAIECDYLSITPFRKRYELKNEIKNPIYLTEVEVSVLAKKKFSSERLTIVRDCYLFSCFTGYAYCDIASLTKMNLGFMGKSKVIMKSRKKTNVIENVPLVPAAEAIIEKYKTHPYCISTGKLLPCNSNQKMNEYLKEIATLCEIDKHLTFHSSRHTFATTALNRGIDINTLAVIGGWSTTKQTSHYARTLDKTLLTQMDKMAGAYTCKNERCLCRAQSW